MAISSSTVTPPTWTPAAQTGKTPSPTPDLSRAHYRAKRIESGGDEDSDVCLAAKQPTGALTARSASPLSTISDFTRAAFIRRPRLFPVTSVQRSSPPFTTSSSTRSGCIPRRDPSRGKINYIKPKQTIYTYTYVHVQCSCTLLSASDPARTVPRRSAFDTTSWFTFGRTKA